MLELTGLVVSAVAQACGKGAVMRGDSVEVTWRHYRYDPPSVWFLDLHIDRAASLAERAVVMTS